MELDPEERILLTEDDIRCIDEICKQQVPEFSEYMKDAIKRYREKMKEVL